MRNISGKIQRMIAGCGLLTFLLLGLSMLPACSKKGGAGNATIPAEPTTTVQPSPEKVELNGFFAADPKRVQARKEELQKITAIKVGGQEIKMDTAMVLIYFMEVRGNYYAMYYESVYGGDYWETEYDDAGRTTRDVFKEETIDTLLRYAVLYDCALKNGMELTEEEKKENEAYVERVKESMTAEEAERGGFTTEGLQKACAWMMTAEKYYDKMTDNLGITRESVSEGIDPEEYREFETEYLYLPTTYYNEEYQVCEETDEVCAERMERMKLYASLLKKGDTFEELMELDDELQYKKRLFRKDGSGAEEAYVTAAKEMNNGELTGPVKTEYGIYLIRMLDTDCRTSYEEAVDAAYEVKKSEAFDAVYRVLLERYPTEINENAWADIILGATVSLME